MTTLQMFREQRYDNFKNNNKYLTIGVNVLLMNRQFPLGVQAATSARVGNALGAGDTQRALLIAKLSLGLSCQSHTSCCTSCSW